MAFSLKGQGAVERLVPELYSCIVHIFTDRFLSCLGGRTADGIAACRGFHLLVEGDDEIVLSCRHSLEVICHLHAGIAFTCGEGDRAGG